MDLCLFFTDQPQEKSYLSISTNKGIENAVQFTINEQIYFIVTLDIPYLDNAYFGTQYSVRIYHNGVLFRSRSAPPNYRYQKWNISIGSGKYFHSGYYEVFLFLNFSIAFQRDCLSYYSMIHSSNIYIDLIILERQGLYLNYYGKWNFSINTDYFLHCT